MRKTLAYRLLHPRPTVLLISKYGKKTNAMALAWSTPVEEDVVAVAIYRGNYSYELVKKSGEFTLNIIPIENLDILWKAGTMSGRKIDKIKELGIELEQGVKIKTPHVKNCLGFLECKVEKEIEEEEHSLFIAEVVYAWAAPEWFKETWKEGIKIPLHVGKNIFAIPSQYMRTKRVR